MLHMPDNYFFKKCWELWTQNSKHVSSLAFSLTHCINNLLSQVGQVAQHSPDPTLRDLEFRGHFFTLQQTHEIWLASPPVLLKDGINILLQMENLIYPFLMLPFLQGAPGCIYVFFSL